MSPYGQSLRLLAEGRFTEAWPMFETRRRFSAPPIYEPPTDIPEWRGEDLAGKTIVVVAEQGYGDQLMFGRYLPMLTRRAAKVVVACHPYMAPIFNLIGLDAELLVLDAPLPPMDFWVLIGSLPHRLGLTYPPPPAYLHLPTGAGGGVGVMTHGSPTLANDANRSLSAAAAARLLAIGRSLAPEATGAINFLATARIVAELDLVVTVDTALAHLAGAMGKPCWVLLPHTGLDWRWGVSGSYSRWYPSMSLYRQPVPGDWDSVLDRIEQDVAALRPLWRQQNAKAA